MDYKKKYKEALATIRLMKPDLNSTELEALETLIPELTESEDERIRKVIHKILLGLRKEIFTTQDEVVTKDKALAYLEKQKEQKPNHNTLPIEQQMEAAMIAIRGEMPSKSQEWSEEDEDMLNSCISSIEEAKENRYAYKENDGDTSYDREINWLKSLRPSWNCSMIQWTGKNLKEVIDFTGKSPKFNEWFKSWDEFESYVHSHGDIIKLFGEDGSYYEVPVGAWIIKTPDGYNIPSRFKFVQKSSWGEEDKEMIERLIRHTQEEYNELCNDTYGHQEVISDLKESCRERMNWLENRLKSLNLQSHWKPSEEQMRALDEYKNFRPALVSLYNDLKKL